MRTMKVGLTKQFGKVAERRLQRLTFAIVLDGAAVGHALFVFLAAAFAALAGSGVSVTCKSGSKAMLASPES